MPKIIRFEDEINSPSLNVRVNDFIRYDNEYIVFQTPFHHIFNYGIPKESIYKNIKDRSYICIDSINPEFKLYNIYKCIDEFIIKELDNMKTKNIIKDTHINYERIISNEKYIKYYLPYNRIQIQNNELDFERQKIYDLLLPEIQSEDRDISFFAKIKLIKELNKDKFFNYIYKYRLLESTDENRYEIKFKTFDEFTSNIKQGTNIRFLIKPRLMVRKNNNENIYFVHLDIFSIEITKKQYINFEYDYDYISRRLSTQLKCDIISTRYKPDNIQNLIASGEIVYSHLFSK